MKKRARIFKRLSLDAGLRCYMTLKGVIFNRWRKIALYSFRNISWSKEVCLQLPHLLHVTTKNKD